MLHDNSLTYISLFSSAGIGCYGFKQEEYHCVATNELIERRLEVQKCNNKCEFDSGYISGDITLQETKDRIYAEIDRWNQLGNDRIDCLIATPPCQGISVINHKKNINDINRNSLVIESVEIVKKIKPRVFVFENVQAFQKTFCVTKDDKIVRIGDYIRDELGSDYIITGRILNFMNYGSNSSRTRTLVIGVDKKYRNTFTPYDLYPSYCHEKTLREVIGNNLPPLKWGEICANDFYHAFRIYDEKMRPWIHDLKEGESAFDNDDPCKRPHRVINGKIVENAKKNRDKYTRQRWDRFVQCIHTRNDQLAAQNTLHPKEDRVFSIRELMLMMTVPADFRWVPYSLAELNNMSDEEKKNIYRQNEVNIRQCLGEAVPTTIVQQIANRLKSELRKRQISPTELNGFINKYELHSQQSLVTFIRENPENLGIAELQRVAELCNAKREENAAYYTNKFLVNEIMDVLPEFGKDELRIIEPSVGAGSFIPHIIKRYENVNHVVLDVVDIDSDSITVLRELLRLMHIPNNFTINVINADFLTYEFQDSYDLAVGNPPYSKLKTMTNEMKRALSDNINKHTKNLSEMFLEKCLRIANYTALVLNKNVLSCGEYDSTREYLKTKSIESIIDFGRYGFAGLSIETICMVICARKKPKTTFIHNMKHNFRIFQEQQYITDDRFPYFLIYRNSEFDAVANKLRFGIFDVFRDRQITKKNTVSFKKDGYIRVIKARNIQDDGTVVDIKDYDAYISPDTCTDLSVSKYINDTSVYLTPNMTYKPRVIKNKNEVVPDGSVAVLIPKEPVELTKEQLDYFTTSEYRDFYLIARNLSTQSINVDAKSVFFYGVKL